jgi:hypothetical protein
MRPSVMVVKFEERSSCLTVEYALREKWEAT